ncbi:alcohol dehydrogenase catalytic domain-containing protein [Paludibaculum fermentans]|uniref:Alcohol dehydrogenase catalytic domain-containing protein n=1 Tax=Paludibaculum fermentans TaxID=1473598 RepID=A0A7S7NRZ7_PALFE|nr:alcohol dehydrogenase catalytic domain-containing protein [Paludibaculum fermentans]QOY88635.1 alcohol dehydrogenase catalytic domain-containing protein [Paludibaculum fermentans]
MRAIGLDFERRTLAERSLPQPLEPREDEVLLRVHEVGICATDRELSKFRFGLPPDGESFLTLGHEALAQVEVGNKDWARGSWVAPMIRRSCSPACDHCARGRRDLCQTGEYLERGINRAHGYLTPFTLDSGAELLAVPEGLLDVAALAEPLSVVEKAVETALRAHPMEPRTAVVTGAGPVGILTALLLQLKGLEVTVFSLEPEDHPRVRLLRKAGLAYLRDRIPARADLVFEAAGGNLNLLEWVAPCGVLMLIGAGEENLSLQPIRMLVDNLTVAGTVNAGRAHFQQAIEDLGRIQRPLLAAMIERRDIDQWRDSFGGPALIPKIVHRLD